MNFIKFNDTLKSDTQYQEFSKLFELKLAEIYDI